MTLRHLMAAVSALLLLMACGCSAKQDIQPVTAQPPFWIAEHPENGAAVYMLGSMHVGERGLVYPEYVTRAFDSSDIIAVEVDVDACTYQEIIEASRELLLPDDTSVEECLGEQYGEAVEFLRDKDVYEKAMEEFIPYYWCSALTMQIADDCGLSSEYGTESILLSRARAQSKQIEEIESLSAQYAMMADIPMDVQVQTLLDTIGEENYAEQVTATRDMYEDWLYFDTDGLESLNDDGADKAPEGYEEFMQLMYLDRQEHMAEYVAECLEDGRNAFVIVGAAHFFFEDDIITLLENSGYTVQEIRG
ncbi:MAG: TraB/GumN family protein [Oscillospiraceae bacterium]|nr:TraB/GumN family protein [Oscillospiraceae bacterium]